MLRIVEVLVSKGFCYLRLEFWVLFYRIFDMCVVVCELFIYRNMYIC